ncbi:MAG: hypothetical protein N2651_00270 [Fimbriimonadales bacterium]|nr:hypothetical protein [Fimbriimonadales bacterium]
MENRSPRWLALLSPWLTFLVGMEGVAAAANGLLLYEQPDSLRDGQYIMSISMSAAAGFWGALPAAILGAILVFRDPDFFRLHALVIGWVGAFVVGCGMLLAGLGAGWEGVLSAFIVFVVAPIGLVLVPLILLDSESYAIILPASLGLILTVLLTYAAYRKRSRQA